MFFLSAVACLVVINGSGGGGGGGGGIIILCIDAIRMRLLWLSIICFVLFMQL